MRFPSVSRSVAKIAVPRAGRVYILPTREGLLFFFALFWIFLAAFAFFSGGALLFVFILFGMAIASMFHTHRNLLGVTAREIAVEDGFAGGTARARVAVSAEPCRERRALEVALKGGDGKWHAATVAHLRASAAETKSLDLPLPGRGIHPAPRARCRTAYPLGLFRSWNYAESAGEFYVYPEPKGDLSWPSSEPGGKKGEGTGASEGGEDFHGHRTYQPGDSLRHVDWKARAKGYPLVTKIFRREGGDPVVCDWDDPTLRHLDTEARLSQLCLWVVAARENGRPCALKLPGRFFSPASDAGHYRFCLRALAAFGHDDRRSPESKGERRTP